MTGNETVKAIKANEDFTGAQIDVDVRKQEVWVSWFDGDKNPQAVSTLTEWGFVPVREESYRKSWKIDLVALNDKSKWVKQDLSKPEPPEWAMR